MSAALRLRALVRRRMPAVADCLGRIEDRFFRLRLGRRVFADIYARNAWGGSESRSGSGSTLEQTHAIRTALPPLLRELGVKSLLDVPCGDHHWMKEVPLDGIRYIGIDIVPAMVERNQRLYGGAEKTFRAGDLVRDPLPPVDLVLSRDCFSHLPHGQILAALRTIKRSGSIYLLTTTFTERTQNEEINRFGWRPVNLQLQPFNLPPPALVINEHCTEHDGQYADKSLGLWKIADLRG
jgi:SAM-dependent methyltransferase